jgi:hypothetical protein
MGKQSRRKAKLRAAGRLPQRTPVERISSTKPTLEHKAAASHIAAAVSSTQANRYQYIIPELRLIAIISGALFLILFVLAFVLS